MRLQTSKSKNATSFYVTKSDYNKGTLSTKIVEKAWVLIINQQQHLK